MKFNEKTDLGMFFWADYLVNLFKTQIHEHSSSQKP